MKDILEKRKSCREYSDIMVPEKYINEILWAGTRAPYASGGSRCFIIPIRDKATKLKIQEICKGQEYVGSCDTIFVACSLNLDKVGEVLRSGRSKGMWDCGAALMCMDLMATSLNLGTCWIGNFVEYKIRELLDIPVNARPEMILITGYPEEEK